MTSDYGKGANAVVSLIHFFFEKHGFGEKEVSLYADKITVWQLEDTPQSPFHFFLLGTPNLPQIGTLNASPGG